MVENYKKRNKTIHEFMKENEKKLVYVHVENMAGLRSFDYDLRHLSDKKMGIIIGPNGFGKSTIFEGLEWLFSQTDECRDLHCDYISYVFEKLGKYEIFQCRKAQTNNGEKFRFFWARSFGSFNEARLLANHRLKTRSTNSLHPVTRDINQIREFFRDANFVKVSSSRLSRTKETEQLKMIADTIITEDVADRFGFDLDELKRYVFSSVPYAVRLENSITENLLLIYNGIVDMEPGSDDFSGMLPVYYLMYHPKCEWHDNPVELDEVYNTMVNEIFPLLDGLFDSNAVSVANIKRTFKASKQFIRDAINRFVRLQNELGSASGMFAYAKGFETAEQYFKYERSRRQQYERIISYRDDRSAKGEEIWARKDEREENHFLEKFMAISDAIKTLKKAITLKKSFEGICSDLDYHLLFQLSNDSLDYQDDFTCRLKVQKRVFEPYAGIEYVDFDIDALSSGEANLLSILCSFFECSFDKRQNFLFIDEPEISLHPEWQARIVDGIEELDQSSNVTVFISTHSPDVIASHNDLVADFKITHKNRD